MMERSSGSIRRIIANSEFNPSDVAQGVRGATVVQDVFPSPRLVAANGREKFDIVTSSSMFYDLEDPIAFARAVAEVLAQDGVWVIELAYLPTMLENDSYDTICHEHLEYYSLAILGRIAREANLRVFRVSLNEINGGSIRCCLTHASSSRHGDAKDLAGVSERRQANSSSDWTRTNRTEHFSGVSKNIVTSSERSYAGSSVMPNAFTYTAHRRRVTRSLRCGIDNSMIDYAANQENPEKHGARTLGTDIPIISEEESRALQPDYYLVLPWHFRVEFLEREKEMLLRGTGLIFPLPKMESSRRHEGTVSRRTTRLARCVRVQSSGSVPHTHVSGPGVSVGDRSRGALHARPWRESDVRCGIWADGEVRHSAAGRLPVPISQECLAQPRLFFSRAGQPRASGRPRRWPLRRRHRARLCIIEHGCGARRTAPTVYESAAPKRNDASRPTVSGQEGCERATSASSFSSRVDHFLPIGACSQAYFEAYGVARERITISPYTVDNAYFSSGRELRAQTRLLYA